MNHPAPQTQVDHLTQSTSAAPRYEFQALDPVKHRDRVLAAFELCWPQPAAEMQAKHEWFYVANPAGTASAFLLHDHATAKDVGLLVVAPRRFLINGEEALGAVFVDFAVAPEHRRLFLRRIKLDLLAFHTASEAGHDAALMRSDFVYCLPNDRSRRVCERTAGVFQFERPRMAAIVRFWPYLARRAPQWAAKPAGAFLDLLTTCADAVSRLGYPRFTHEWLDEVDERFDVLWSRVSRVDRCIGVRDRAFLHWRFFARPGAHQNRVLAVLRPGTQSLLAYFVTELIDGMLVVRDALCVGSTTEQIAAWKLLRGAARACGAYVVTCEIHADEKVLHCLRRAGYHKRGSTTVFIRLASLCGDWLREAKPWYLTRADEDV
ncbi:MAG TPA: hypothetical protein VHK24_07860 [Steroidobacter sp.]|jgi:hypothetical protein|nr:hypothetical protein [Steroidobacter sp.]